MYGRSFEDPDGHIWVVLWMDVVAVKQAMSNTVEARSTHAWEDDVVVGLHTLILKIKV